MGKFLWEGHPMRLNSRATRVIVLVAATIVVAGIAIVGLYLNGLSKIAGPCPPGITNGGNPPPTRPPVVIYPLPQSQTPRSNLVSRIGQPQPSPTQPAYVFRSTIDLSPTLAVESKTELHVCHRDGTFVRIYGVASMRLEDYPLVPGDIVVIWLPPRSSGGVDVPKPPFPSPGSTRNP